MADADPGVTLPSPSQQQNRGTRLSLTSLARHANGDPDPGVTLPSLQEEQNRPREASRSPFPPPSLPRGDPAFRVEQEMKGRRPKRPPFNQIRLPLQAQAGNRPTN